MLTVIVALVFRMAKEAGPINLNKNDRRQLQSLTRKHNLPQGFVRRIRPILLADEGFQNSEIAVLVDLHRNSFGKWRSRYNRDGLAGLEDRPRSGKPPKYPPAQIQNVVTKVCGNPPEGTTR